MATLFETVFTGADQVVAAAEGAVEEASKKYSDMQTVSFPDTAYYLTLNYGFSGNRVTTVGDMKSQLKWINGELVHENRTSDVFRSGIATACAAELIEACKYIEGTPVSRELLWGHFTDAEVVAVGNLLTSGAVKGIAVIINAAPSQDEAVALVRGYQEKGVCVFLVGDVIDQILDAGIETGFDAGILPLGYDLTSVIHVVSVSVRAAFVLGGVEAGDYDGICDFTIDNIPAFVNAFGPLDAMTVACGAGAIALGYPVITNQVVPFWSVPESLLMQPDVSRFIATSLEARGIEA